MIRLAQDDGFHGHSIEWRINVRTRLLRPSPGKIVTNFIRPAGWAWSIRRLSRLFDPALLRLLVGKLIVHGKTRGECLMRLKRALDEFVVDVPYHFAVPRWCAKDIIDGDYHIRWLEDFYPRRNEDGGSIPFSLRSPRSRRHFFCSLSIKVANCSPLAGVGASVAICLITSGEASAAMAAS
jgi:hypothetical protein